MATEKDAAINKLIVGQVKMEKDIVEMREDITEIKEDVTGLKQGQHSMDHMMLKLLEEMTSVKKIVINSDVYVSSVAYCDYCNKDFFVF